MTYSISKCQWPPLHLYLNHLSIPWFMVYVYPSIYLGGQWHTFSFNSWSYYLESILEVNDVLSLLTSATTPRASVPSPPTSVHRILCLSPETKVNFSATGQYSLYTLMKYCTLRQLRMFSDLCWAVKEKKDEKYLQCLIFAHTKGRSLDLKVVSLWGINFKLIQGSISCHIV